MAEEKTSASRTVRRSDLKDLYSAENQIIKALPKMAKNCHQPQLKRAFETPSRGNPWPRAAARTDRRGARLHAQRQKCKGAEGLIEEGKEVMEEFDDERSMPA